MAAKGKAGAVRVDAVLSAAALARLAGVDASTVARWRDAGLPRDGLTATTALRWLADRRKPKAGQLPGAGLTDGDGNGLDAGEAGIKSVVLKNRKLTEEIEKLRLANERVRRDLIPIGVFHALADRWGIVASLLAKRLEAVVRVHGEQAVADINQALGEAERDALRALDDMRADVDAGRFAPPGVEASPVDGRAGKAKGGRPRKGDPDGKASGGKAKP